MRIIIAGPRAIQDYATVWTGINAGLSALHIQHVTEVLSGMALGVDQLGERWAHEHGVPVRQFPADWKTYGKRAGFVRNAAMAREAQAAIVIWDGFARGSGHMIQVAQDYRLALYVHRVPAGS